MAKGEEEGDFDGHGLAANRIEALSDGIFAIAMTILVLGISIPGWATQTNLLQAILSALPNLFVFFLSFAAIGIYWLAHHSQFHWVKHTDRKFLWINLLFLAFIALIPFSTSLLARFPGQSVAFILYDGNLLLCGACMLLMWNYITTHPMLTHGPLKQEVVRAIYNRITYTAGFGALAIVVCFFSTTFAIGILALDLLSAILISRTDRLFVQGA